MLCALVLDLKEGCAGHIGEQRNAKAILHPTPGPYHRAVNGNPSQRLLIGGSRSVTQALNQGFHLAYAGNRMTIEIKIRVAARRKRTPETGAEARKASSSDPRARRPSPASKLTSISSRLILSTVNSASWTVIPAHVAN